MIKMSEISPFAIPLFMAFVFCLWVLPSGAQQCTIKEIKRRPNTGFNNTKEFTISYPIIATGVDYIDKKINAKIRSVLIVEDDKKLPIGQALDAEISEGFIVEMSYTVTLCKHHIISMYVTTQGCGAYCSTWAAYFNFNWKNGELLSLEDMLNEDGLRVFRDTVSKHKLKALADYKNEMNKQLVSAEVDSDDYKWAMEEVNENCINSLSTKDFLLSGVDIEVFDGCDFPHAIQSLAPDYKLRYPYSFLKQFLKPEYIHSLLDPP